MFTVAMSGTRSARKLMRVAVVTASLLAIMAFASTAQAAPSSHAGSAQRTLTARPPTVDTSIQLTLWTSGATPWAGDGMSPEVFVTAADGRDVKTGSVSITVTIAGDSQEMGSHAVTTGQAHGWDIPVDVPGTVHVTATYTGDAFLKPSTESGSLTYGAPPEFDRWSLCPLPGAPSSLWVQVHPDAGGNDLHVSMTWTDSNDAELDSGDLIYYGVGDSIGSSIFYWRGAIHTDPGGHFEFSVHRIAEHRAQPFKFNNELLVPGCAG